MFSEINNSFLTYVYNEIFAYFDITLSSVWNHRLGTHCTLTMEHLTTHIC